MAHVVKYTKSTMGHMFAHYDRSANNIGNENINPDKSYLNYNLASNFEKPQIQILQDKISDVKCLNRKDVKVLCSWVVTAPSDLPEKDNQKFFKESFDFLSKRYGEKNVISAYVHMDEITPHMHFAFIPIVKDKKKGHLKVSAKETITRVDLKSFHQDLDKHMTKVFGRDIGVLNNATKDGNKTISELKQKTEIEKLTKLKQETSQIAKTASEIKNRINSLENQKERLQHKIQRLEGAFRVSSDNPKGKPNLTSTKITFTKKEAEDLIKTSKSFFAKNLGFNSAIKELKEANKEIYNLKISFTAKRIDNLVLENQELKQINSKLEKSVKTLKKEKSSFLDKLQKVISKLPKEFSKLFEKLLKSSEKSKSKNLEHEL